MRLFFLFAVSLIGPCFAQQNQILEGDSLAPFFPSPQIVVEHMLKAAQVKPGEVVYDLGCGDGRVVITAAQKFQARAVGVEIKETLVRSTSKRVAELGLSEMVKIIHGNALNTDLSGADVVTLYLLTKSNEMLRPNLEKHLKSGSRVVSYEYEIRGWKPVSVQQVQVDRLPHKIFVYEMPLSRDPNAKQQKK
jgi:tRNA G37 N-methylase Trm5